MLNALMLTKKMLGPAYSSTRLAAARVAWRQANPHNFTDLGMAIPRDRVSVGQGTYGTLWIRFFGDPEERVEIGHFCSIAADVHILAGGEHDFGRPSSYPFRNRFVESGFVEAKTKGPVAISDDVWVGHRSTILSGVRIGQGAVIGAGSLVSRDVPPYAVFAGTSVRRLRFDDLTIRRLLRFNYGLLTPDLVRQHSQILEAPLSESFFDSELYEICSEEV